MPRRTTTSRSLGAAILGPTSLALTIIGAQTERGRGTSTRGVMWRMDSICLAQIRCCINAELASTSRWCSDRRCILGFDHDVWYNSAFCETACFASGQKLSSEKEDLEQRVYSIDVDPVANFLQMLTALDLLLQSVSLASVSNQEERKKIPEDLP